MNCRIFWLALLLPITASAQTAQPKPEKLCGQQGRIYVTKTNNEEPGPEPQRSFYWSFLAAYYDSRTDSCYVMYGRFVRAFGAAVLTSPSNPARFLEQLRIDDVEGNRVAAYSGIWTSNRNGRPAYSTPSECMVNKTSCESISEFDERLGDFIPAFKITTPRWPVDG